MNKQNSFRNHYYKTLINNKMGFSKINGTFTNHINRNKASVELQIRTDRESRVRYQVFLIYIIRLLIRNTKKVWKENTEIIPRSRKRKESRIFQ